MPKMPKKSLGGDLVRRTFVPPSLAPGGGSMEFQLDGFHTKPGTNDPAEGPSGAKGKAIRGMSDAEKDAFFFKHTQKDNLK